MTNENRVSLDETANENIDVIDETTLTDIPLTVRKESRKNVRIKELTELRGENNKTFALGDGSKQTVFYSRTVHVADEESGELVEVDNALDFEEDGKHYSNGRNRFSTRFNSSEDDAELFVIEKGRYRISVGMAEKGKRRKKGVTPVFVKKAEGYSVGEQTVAVNKPAAVTDEEKLVLTEQMDADEVSLKGRRHDFLIFENHEPGTDMEYTVLSDGVKENIIVKEKAEEYRYPFWLHCENVEAELSEDAKRVSFRDKETGEEVFFIPEPLMQSVCIWI